jgi:hypothetical protein
MPGHLDCERALWGRGIGLPGSEIQDQEDEENDDRERGGADDSVPHPEAVGRRRLAGDLNRRPAPMVGSVERRQYYDHPDPRAHDPHELPERVDPLGLRTGRRERGMGAGKLERLLQQHAGSVRAHGWVVDGG